MLCVHDSVALFVSSLADYLPVVLNILLHGTPFCKSSTCTTPNSCPATRKDKAQGQSKVHEQETADANATTLILLREQLVSAEQQVGGGGLGQKLDQQNK